MIFFLQNLAVAIAPVLVSRALDVAERRSAPPPPPPPESFAIYVARRR